MTIDELAEKKGEFDRVEREWNHAPENLKLDDELKKIEKELKKWKK